MVINPGATEAFTLIFQSFEVKEFDNHVKYYINYKPFNLNYKADVRNVSLKISTNNMKFQFKNDKISDKAEFTQIQKLKLINRGNAPVVFKWENPNKPFFSIKPMNGIVNPNELFEVDIGFTALEGIWKEEITDELKCNLDNGYPFTINVSGILFVSRCSVVNKENLIFDCIHVGVEETKDFIIKNENKTFTAYSIVI